jgi:hypothetical protein
VVIWGRKSEEDLLSTFNSYFTGFLLFFPETCSVKDISGKIGSSILTVLIRLVGD